MSNEIVTNEENAVANYLSNQGDISDIPQRTGFIPYLNIAYGMSDSVSNGLATPGDFVFEGKVSLGKSVEVIVADFRLHLSVYDETTSKTIADCYARSDDPQRGKSAEFLAFRDQVPAKGQKLHEGIDLLLWIPAVNSFAVIYLKSTTYDAFADIYRNGKGGRLVQMSTRAGVSKKTGRKFFLIDSVATNRAVVGSAVSTIVPNVVCDVAIPTDFAVAAVKKFKEFSNTEISTEVNVSDR